ncbi:MAG: TonB-dependent receptor plug domain-containing protein [Kordiimonadaceae bacterium]|nr:TonB-dependent receptor plug domain-containing protein [Kordiimonadaceae bacterium]
MIKNDRISQANSLGASTLLSSILLATSPLVAQDSAASDDALELEEVVVVGSYFKSTNFTSKAPLSIMSADELEQNGINDIGDLVRFQPSLSSSFVNGSFNAGGSVGAARVRVRNLSTLVLLNGRRQVSTGTASGEVDVNSLVPKIAIQRVEILKDGAASLYGADAVGGVVNFVTDRNFVGLELEGGYSSVTEGAYDDYTVEAKFGEQFGDLHLMAAVSYFDRGQLNGEDRSFTRDAGNIGIGYPMTFFIPAAFGAAPVVEGQCGELADTALRPAAPVAFTTLPGGLGTLPAICDIAIAPYQGLVASSERIQGYATATYDVNEDLQIFAEVAYANVHSNLHSPASLPLQDASNPLFIPGSHPQNPFAPISGGADIFAIGFPFLQIGPDRGLRADIDMVLRVPRVWCRIGLGMLV